ncbi:DinB family protein [Halalkalibacillus sediminis]|uniref:DinB family protein n=1 Tax=Halalkalibacillus sediminis TaxID=2018042 RepID=A0A2I0QTB9_9BACI|nr:DinB family protein [Halalkalibacillus sediminis]PKR77587.1 DinB family protein [Halalkalibacillus sediminis]
MNQRQEVLFNQLETYREELLSNVENVSEEEAELIPKVFNNNIRWNLGHIYMDQYMWIKVLTKDDLYPDSFNHWFGFGNSPSDFDDETPSFEELKHLLKNQTSKIKELYGDRLEEEFPPTEMGMFTIEQVLSRTIFHEGMHTQAINDLKRYLRIQ